MKGKTYKKNSSYMYTNKEYSVIKCFVAKMNIDPQAIFTFEGADITSS